MRTPALLTLGLIAILAAACTSAGSSASPAPASVAPSASTAVASTAPSVAPSVAPSQDACAAADLATLTAGKLTIGTDNPAFPPYFAPNADGHTTAPWELGDPTNGQGFEGAFAYALAEKLGFTKDQVAWTYVPFDNSFKPGAKSFDLDINQVSVLPERTGAVDFSDGYYFLNQAVVALAANPVAKVKTISGLADYRFGAQVGTSSYKTITDIIKPKADPRVYDTNDAAIAALKAKQIDAIVADLPTAFYMTGAQLDDKGAVVGQFQLPSGAEVEHFGVVMAKGSSLKPCVDAAIKALTDDGTLAALTQEWLSDKAAAPIFTP
jgi:polar amino acid transport system substrate-binding protein